MTPLFVVGIDLGTTHVALAYAELDGVGEPVIHSVPIPQTVRPGAVETRKLLPACLYLPAENELPAGSLALPWNEHGPRTASGAAFVIGEFARARGGEVPGSLVSSAKSWLCQNGDRHAGTLPFQAPAGVPRISPVEAQTLVLRHLADTWDHAVAPKLGAENLAAQKIVLCVPSSFDAAARELTLEAARGAGLQDITLLEEPQAAFYAWIEQSHEGWRKQVQVGERVLVVDVGGGTSDFCLIAVENEGGALSLRRIAAGGHILLGGDNMDLALAHAAAERLEKNARLDAWQLRSLTLACREGKERLFDPANSQTELALSVLGRGGGVIGEAVTVKLACADAMKLIEDGFFELCSADARPRSATRGGLRELGLNYAAEPAVTRHLAKFLADAHEVDFADSESGLVKPTAVLFNGGVMKAAVLRGHVVSALNAWTEGPPPRLLSGGDLELAVARGAAFHGLVQRGKGVRIRGGATRSYYIGIESAAPSVPGRAAQIKALCVAPFGMEEGTDIDVPAAEFGLVVGEPAQFRFLASTVRRADQAGELIEDWNGSLHELPPVEANLPPAGKAKRGDVVRVRLRSKVTEVGTLELWCHEQGGDGAWKLELSVR